LKKLNVCENLEKESVDQKLMEENTSKIDESMRVLGDIVTDGDLLLEGELQGSFVGRNLIVGASGSIVGQVTGKTIDCAGRLEGNVQTESLKLRSGGCQVGTVVTRALEVEPGAEIDCALQSGALAAPLSAPEPVAKEVVPAFNFNKYLGAFAEDQRPCCYEVPWSERRELYEHIVDLLKKDKKLIKVVGEEGSGKSVLVSKILNDSSPPFHVLLLKEKVGSVANLLQEVALSLGLLDQERVTGQEEHLAVIRLELARRHGAGERVVLLIDDAEEMFQATMEGALRLLCGAYGEEGVAPEMLLQIIIFGTRKMKDNMVATILEYFEDETNCQIYLEPLTMKDTADYLRLGLQLASRGKEAEAMSLLPNETIKEIHVRSKGSVAAINILIDKGLKKAHELGDAILTPQVIKEVVTDGK
jgi:type II secretory pathway predicted ATPase ExeA/cytoskeletal protein CcmA (bactofilin family)